MVHDLLKNLTDRNKKTAYRKTVNGHGHVFKTLWAVQFADANSTAHKVRRDSRTAAQGM